MDFDALVEQTSPAFFARFGGTFPLSLHGIADGTVQGDYNGGGDEMQLATGEIVVTRPTLYLSEADAARISKDHTLTTKDGDMRVFGSGIPDGTGNTTLTLVKHG